MVEKELTCNCEQVALVLQGKPIVSTECLCADCQSAGADLQSLPDAPPLVDDKGATRFVLYRKDRIRWNRGQHLLREHRLSKDSKTRRVVAGCCNTPVFLEFTQGHWLSLYGGLWPAETLPTLELRTMARSRPEGVALPDDVPNPNTHNFSFFAKLLLAWAAMRFRTPRLDFIEGDLDVR
ncbi:hypothetical protein E4656_14905 [Natronospirillum operosum]|uniref:CENP-V/GFA domain-containing protein n=1 Tax=Natronospirillum operosum TaxID=2759953 RepID=A0A4Z0WBU7_9GAMM|nr:hypothetical protein [Natronospirillum operosum]TGG91685.1 hypothetical protein E4656_14905 [Natronospirillum operosum]